MKKQFIFFLSIVLIILLTPMYAFADGDTNVDGGGGDVGGGDVVGGSYWSVGDDGVRVSIVEEQNKKVLRTVNFSNKKMTVDFWFGNVSKLGYSSGKALNMQLGNSYKDIVPDNSLPQIVSSNGATSIEAVKQYFGQEGTLKDIAEKTNFPYDTLIGGDYVLLLEPIIYVRYDGDMYALTATQAALLDQIEDGKLKTKLGYATHQNLPLAMFLEKPDLGYPAWEGPRTGVRSDSEIISSLGLGTVRFRDSPPAPPPATGDSSYDYRTNTDVITAVTVRNNSGDAISPDDGAKVTVTIDGTRYTKPFVTPPNEDTLIWVRWHTPDTPQTVNVSVSSTHGSVDASTITCNVSELVEKTPPDPQLHDEPPYNYNVPHRPWGLGTGTRTLAWGEWLPRWVPDWQWVADWDWVSEGHGSSCTADCDKSHGSWEDNGEWQDLGWWEYDWRDYSASLAVTTKVAPAAEVPTAKNLGNGHWEMKSGYGVALDVTATTSTNGKSSDVTPVQNGVAFFPEFGYKDYFRVLAVNKSGLRSSLSFAFNKYSFMGASVHYTPIWFPDRSEYAPKVQVFDVWTPAGQLHYTNSNWVNINGDCLDDWNIAPYKE